MEVIRNKDKNNIIIKEKDKIFFEMGYIGEDLAFILYGNEPLIINEKTDEALYHNLKNIMKNDYIFKDNISQKKEKILIWLSDDDLNHNSKSIEDSTNRLIIEEKDSSFIVSCHNPYFIKNKMRKSYNLILFSTTEIGKNSENLKTGNTFQKDIKEMFNKTYENNLIKENKTRVRK